MVITTTGRQEPAEQLIDALPGRAWPRVSAGPGAHGPRVCHWARLPICIG